MLKKSCERFHFPDSYYIMEIEIRFGKNFLKNFLLLKPVKSKALIFVQKQRGK